jgi:hypothetical protein
MRGDMIVLCCVRRPPCTMSEKQPNSSCRDAMPAGGSLAHDHGRWQQMKALLAGSQRQPHLQEEVPKTGHVRVAVTKRSTPKISAITRTSAKAGRPTVTYSRSIAATSWACGPPFVSRAKKPPGCSMSTAPWQMAVKALQPDPWPPSSADHGSYCRTSAWIGTITAESRTSGAFNGYAQTMHVCCTTAPSTCNAGRSPAGM